MEQKLAEIWKMADDVLTNGIMFYALFCWGAFVHIAAEPTNWNQNQILSAFFVVCGGCNDVVQHEI